MIKNRKDLRFYLDEDAKRNNCKGWWRYHVLLFAGYECAYAYKYIRLMRKCEYHLNNSSDSLYHKAFYQIYKIRLNHLGIRLNLKITLNACGYGLRILHLSGGWGILLNVDKVGNYCAFNAGVLIGNKGTGNKLTIGNNVAFGAGC